MRILRSELFLKKNTEHRKTDSNMNQNDGSDNRGLNNQTTEQPLPSRGKSDDLLSDGEAGESEGIAPDMVSTIVKGNVFGEQVNILLDAGSQC
nr:unnamed protein product [Callosobruchus analis]